MYKSGGSFPRHYVSSALSPDSRDLFSNESYLLVRARHCHHLDLLNRMPLIPRARTEAVSLQIEIVVVRIIAHGNFICCRGARAGKLHVQLFGIYTWHLRSYLGRAAHLAITPSWNGATNGRDSSQWQFNMNSQRCFCCG
jgi:hypothetical protein